MTETPEFIAQRIEEVRERRKAKRTQTTRMNHYDADVELLLSALDDARAAAKQDAERLDWIESIATERNVICSGIEPSSDTAFFSVGLEHGGGCDDYEGYTLRRAIDAARSPVAVRETTDNG